mmetsp:Transcript_21139/g.42064  ORF Transcript_21139/g.42064 Transcript_21139/m.42064 type:complete len:670 (+) Transcript_21139:51-2060(+)
MLNQNQVLQSLSGDNMVIDFNCKRDVGAGAGAGAISISRLRCQKWMIATCLAICNAVAFLLGWGARIVLLPRNEVLTFEPPGPLQRLGPMFIGTSKILNETVNIPPYISVTRHWSVIRSSSDEDEEVDENDDESPTIGSHLFVDIKNVNTNFLSSEKQLKNAMFSLLMENEFEPLSYYCRSLDSAGFSCHGQFDAARINLYTYPHDGIISLDIFSTDEDSSVTLLEDIKEEFAISEENTEDENEDYPSPQFIWTHKLRKFDATAGSVDTQDILSQHSFEMKKQLAFVETKYQNVHFYEAINTRFRSVVSYEKSLSKDGSYESLHPELFRQDKIVFLDGDSQSSLYGEAVYHEGLVHAAMLTHPNPKRVAIIGGGEGATLREVLKHKTVQEVVMIDIDGEFVQLCRKYLPEWSDCSDLVGSTTPSCFDDDRARVYFEDAFQWFIDRFAAGKRHADPEEDFFDVIIMDACDPTNDFVTKLYVDSTFVKSLYNGLSKSGVFIAQIGRAAAAVVDETAMFKRMFSDVGFRSMHIYDEGRSGFYEPWSHLVALKNTVSRKLWYQNAANIDIELHKRIVSTHSGEPALLYFDASVMLSYQLPHMVHEDVYCRLHLQQCYAVEDMVKNRDLDLTVIDDGDPFNPLYERNVFYNKPNATVFSILAENGVAKFISLVP